MGDKLSKLLYMFYVAGFNHGSDRSHEVSITDAFEKMKQGKPYLGDSESYPRVPELMREILHTPAASVSEVEEKDDFQSSQDSTCDICGIGNGFPHNSECPLNDDQEG